VRPENPRAAPITSHSSPISRSPQIHFPPPQGTAHRGQPYSGQSNPPSASFKLLPVSVMLTDPSNWARSPLTVGNAWIFGPSVRSPWPDQISPPIVQLTLGNRWLGCEFGFDRRRASVLSPIDRPASSPELLRALPSSRTSPCEEIEP
jgi:hypothetical protein